MKYFSLLLFFSSISFLGNAQVNTKNQSFDEFWKNFRTALLLEDYKKLESFISFPLKVRGPMDYDPTKKYSKNNYIKLLKKYFALENAAALQQVKNKEQLTEQNYGNNTVDRKKIGEMRIFDMEFYKIKGKWFLSFLYWPDSEGY